MRSRLWDPLQCRLLLLCWITVRPVDGIHLFVFSFYFWRIVCDLYQTWCMTLAHMVPFWYAMVVFIQWSIFKLYLLSCMHSHCTHVVGWYFAKSYISDLYGESFDECQNTTAGLLSVSMKPRSKDRVFLMWIDIEFMHNHNNLSSILQVSVSNVLGCFRNHCSCA